MILGGIWLKNLDFMHKSVWTNKLDFKLDKVKFIEIWHFFVKILTFNLKLSMTSAE